MRYMDCVIITTPGGPTNGCIRAQLPSLSKIVALSLLNVCIMLITAWLIFTFLEPRMNVNYWMVLLVLFIASVIANLIFWFIPNVI